MSFKQKNHTKIEATKWGKFHSTGLILMPPNLSTTPFVDLNISSSVIIYFPEQKKKKKMKA